MVGPRNWRLPQGYVGERNTVLSLVGMLGHFSDGVDLSQVRPMTDQAQPASKLRPVSSKSTWWRMFIGAKLKRPSTQTWLERSLPEGLQAVAKGRDGASAFMVWGESYAQGQWIGTLDLTKLSTTSLRVAQKSRWIGTDFPKCSPGLCCVCGQAEKVVTMASRCLPSGSECDHFYTQGDGLSPRVMNLLSGSKARTLPLTKLCSWTTALGSSMVSSIMKTLEGVLLRIGIKLTTAAHTVDHRAKSRRVNASGNCFGGLSRSPTFLSTLQTLRRRFPQEQCEDATDPFRTDWTCAGEPANRFLACLSTQTSISSWDGTVLLAYKSMFRYFEHFSRRADIFFPTF